jgi:MoaA/NifB/PqqE/SkfB family radical SAM enzyme
MKKNIIRLQLDEKGHLILPDEIMKRLGFLQGAIIRLEEDKNCITIHRTSSSLARIYVEPTNRCNLDCSTCMRNVWKEPLGNMTHATYERIIQSAKEFIPIPMIFFGGFGEPLAHPNIIEMILEAKALGAEVELITNGILLDKNMAERIISSGLNRIWISIDGATPQSYKDVRLGDALPQVLDNLMQLRLLKTKQGRDHPRVGIAFVAMKQNIGDLPAIIRIGNRVGADHFSISNVLPHTEELRNQVLFSHSMNDGDLQPSQWSPVISIPRIDMNHEMIQKMEELYKTPAILEFADQEFKMGINTCPFIRKGSVSVRWDGAVSPCLSLLHTHESYLDDHIRKSLAYQVGDINRDSLLQIWNSPEYVNLRERLIKFDFSPCTFCNSCYMADENLEDCFGNSQPACGGCLWAQGFIQCP